MPGPAARDTALPPRSRGTDFKGSRRWSGRSAKVSRPAAPVGGRLGAASPGPSGARREPPTMASAAPQAYRLAHSLSQSGICSDYCITCLPLSLLSPSFPRAVLPSVVRDNAGLWISTCLPMVLGTLKK